MKRYLNSIFCSLVALSALLLLASCGGGTTTSNTATPTTAVATPTPVTPTTAPTSPPTATPTQAANGQTVMITTDNGGSFAFSPATLTIKAGTTVTWKNNTGVGHTVTSDDGKSFDSGDSTPIAAGATFSFTFTKAGTFAYHCDIHPFMKATIIVQ